MLKAVQFGYNFADWCRMTCRLRWYGRNRNQKQNSNIPDVLGNSMAYHPRATCHIAGWKNSIRHIDKNLAIANRSSVSCAHDTLRASIDINITPWPWNLS